MAKAKAKKQWWSGLSAAEIANQVYVAARLAFPRPEWLPFEEFTLTTGSHTGRIDLFAISIWGPTRVVCCELKASRSDFQREIADPRKRKRALEMGTEFVFILPVGMVQPDEIPDGCGLYEVMRNQRMRKVKHGTQRVGIEWSPAMFHEVIRRVAYKEDRLHWLFANQMSGAKLYRDIFRAYDKQWTFEELIGLTHTLYRGLKFNEDDVIASKLDYNERVRNDETIQTAFEIQNTVRRLCGWQAGKDNDGFTEWFERNTGQREIKRPHFPMYTKRAILDGARELSHFAERIQDYIGSLDEVVDLMKEGGE